MNDEETRRSSFIADRSSFVPTNPACCQWVEETVLAFQCESPLAAIAAI
jgi:hypothetical protein